MLRPITSRTQARPVVPDGPSRRSVLGGMAGLGVVGAAALAGCTDQGGDAPAPSGSLKDYTPPGAADEFVETSASQRHTVRINQAFQSLLYLPLYIANDVGFFDDEGIDLEVSTGGGGSQAWAAVLGGSADYSIQDPIFPSVSAAKGMRDGVVVGTIANGMACLAVAKDPGIETVTNARDFMTKVVKGRSVATQPEPDSAWAQMRYLGELYGVKLGEDFENVQVQLGSEPNLVVQDRADLAVGWPPSVDLSLGQGLNEVFDFSSFWGGFALSGLSTKRPYIEENPQAHQGVMNALELASQYAYAFPDEAVKVAQREFRTSDPDLVAASTRRMLSRLLLPQHVAVEQLAWDQNQFVNEYAGIVKTTTAYHAGVDSAAALQASRTFGNAALTTWTSPRAIVDEVTA